MENHTKWDKNGTHKGSTPDANVYWFNCEDRSVQIGSH